MARKRTKIVRTLVSEPVEDDEQDPFKLALQEFGDDQGVTLHVYRYDPMTGKPRYAKSVPFVKELHGLEWLQRMFGAGDYLLRFYDSEGNSKNRSVSIDDDPTRTRKEPEPGASSNAARDELVSVLREQNNLLMQAALKGSAPAAAPAESPVVLKILDALLPQALAKPDISGPLLGMLEKGIAIAMETKADSEGGTVGLIRSIAKDLGPVFAEFARARMMTAAAPSPRPVPYVTPAPPIAIAPGAPLPPPPSSPAPAPALPTNGPTVPPEDMARAMVEGTIRFGVELVEKAERDHEAPRDVADWILGEIPPNYYEHLADLSYEKLISIQPRYASITKDWLEEVLKHVRDEAREPQEEADAPSPGSH